MDWEDALALLARQRLGSCHGEDILATIEDDISEDAHDRGYDFFTGVEETVRSLMETIENNQTCTPSQCTALENMQSGVNRWVK